MKLIDNRYKIETFIEDGGYYESYKTIDLWSEEKIQYIKIYNSQVKKELIDYYINNFKFLSNIKHDSLLLCSKFNLIKTIDMKRINFIRYYTITEYNINPNLNQLIHNLNLNARLKIFLETLLIIDFLHFRGITYKHLNPYNIFVSEDYKIKITDLSTIIEKEKNIEYKELDTYFISPKYLTNKIDNKQNDYYSIGILAKYMFLEEFYIYNLDEATYNKSFKLTTNQKKEMNNIINQLVNEDESVNNLNLLEIVEKIKAIFNLEYIYDSKISKNVLNFQNKITGRYRDIQKIIEIDKKILNQSLDYRGIIINAKEGVGKTRLIEEISYQLKIRGRDLYSIEIFDDGNKDFLYISEILKQSIKDAHPDLMDKYRDELSKILPELRISVLENIVLLEQKTEIFRLYNRITNYFNELSQEKIIYIVIDNLHYANNNVLMLLDYLVRNIRSRNMFFIFSFENDNKFINPSVEVVIDRWFNDDLFKKNELYKLSVQEIGEMLKNILGISYIPINFATALFKEGEGNPKYIEYTIKDLFSKNNLYIGEKGNWFIEADSYSDIKFAKDMQDVLIKQLQTIKEEYYEIFKVMSIFNDILSKKTLFKMMDKGNIEVGDILDKLIGLNLVDEKVTDWGYGYCINNIELKRLIYDDIIKEERIDLHNRAANILESFGVENYNSVIEELLLHLDKSNQSKRALRFIFDSSETIKNKYSYTILYLWEKAYGIVKEEVSEIKLDILKKMLNIYHLKGIGEKIDQYLGQYQRESEELNSYMHIINGKLLESEDYYKAAKLELGLKIAKEIEKISEENNIIEGKIISLIIKSKFRSRYGTVKNLEPDLKIALELSQAYGINQHKGNIFNLLGLNDFMNGKTEDALGNYEKSVYYHEKNGNFFDATKPINNIGNIYTENYGNDKKAMEYYEKGLEIAYKYGFREIEMIFLNNISEIYIRNYEFDKAMEYIKDSRKIAIEIQDINMELLTNVNVGTIQLITGEYKKLQETYNHLKSLHEIKGIINIEMDTQYNNFLGNFYGLFGNWNDSIYYSKIAADMCKGFSLQEYLTAKSRIIYIKFLRDEYFNKTEVENIRNEYKKTQHINNRRFALLNFAIISFISGDVKYSKELLEEELELSNLYKNDFLICMREMIILSMDTRKSSINKMIDLKSKLSTINFFSMEFLCNAIIGLKLFKNELYEESIRCFLDGLDDIYNNILKLSNFQFQTSYIKSRKGDLLKENIAIAIKKSFNKDLEYSLFTNINEENLYSYFDFTSIFEILDNEDISKLAKLEYYGEAMKLNSVEDLISNFTGDFRYNLDLIINYISKETLATIGLILSYNNDLRKFTSVSSIGNNLDYEFNLNILNLATQDRKGILINNKIKERPNKRYKEFLTEDVKGIICVPIFVLKDNSKYDNDRRNNYKYEEEIQAFIYLETDKSFNKFDSIRLEKIINLSYLIYTNLENNKLKSIANTDKITGLYTRKYYEVNLEQTLSELKLKDDMMSLIMLDIDNFKNVNDIYGHPKGDEVLRLLGLTLQNSVRSSDIVARYGGEEFIILLKNTNRDEVVLIAEKIRHEVEMLKIPGIAYSITISLGISLYPTHSRYKEELIVKADQALYYAKEMGKNKVIVWDSKMTSTLNRSDKLAGILNGNMNEDNRNILAMIDIVELIKKDITMENKIFIFLGILLKTIDGENATLILNVKSKEEKVYYSRYKNNDYWTMLPNLNYNIIEETSKKQKGQFFIDWDDTNSIDPLSGLPNWKSIIVLPLVKNGQLKGIIYISVPIKLKEFSFGCFNISKNFGDIFAALL